MYGIKTASISCTPAPAGSPDDSGARPQAYSRGDRSSAVGHQRPRNDRPQNTTDVHIRLTVSGTRPGRCAQHLRDTDEPKKRFSTLRAAHRFICRYGERSNFFPRGVE
jgi:hypothetical protein